MKTCLFVNNSPQPGRAYLAKLGGGGKSLLSLLKALPEHGWRAHVVVPGEGQFTDILQKLGVNHCIYPFTPMDLHHPVKSYAMFRWWSNLLQRIQPEIIHANGFELSRSFAPSAYLANIPFITHVRFPVEPSGIRWVLKRLPKPEVFIFNSHAMKDKLWNTIHGQAPASRAYTVHNAVDLSSFKPSPRPAAPPYKIGIVANFAEFKRHEDFLYMAQYMLRYRLDLQFQIVGDDTEGKNRRNDLVQLAEQLGIRDRVQFFGHRSDIPEVMQALHVLVVPSKFEPFGRVVIEAMACGRPVVGSNEGGIPEIIQHGETGYLVEAGHPNKLADATLGIIADKALWLRMSSNGVERALDKFSLSAHVASILKIYEELIEVYLAKSSRGLFL